jgi:hypothetical protein
MKYKELFQKEYCNVLCPGKQCRDYKLENNDKCYITWADKKIDTLEEQNKQLLDALEDLIITYEDTKETNHKILPIMKSIEAFELLKIKMPQYKILINLITGKKPEEL